MLKPYVFRKAITTAATAERLHDGKIRCSYIRIQAEDDNTGVFYLGDVSVNSAEGIELKVSAQAAARTVPAVEFYATKDDLLSLRDFWGDVGTSGDGVIVFCLRKD